MPKRPVIVGGTIAIDHIKTPFADQANLLGGSASYAALAASIFTSTVHLVGVVGQDFPQEHLAMLERHQVDLAGVEHSQGNSFTWTGEYHENMNDRTTHQVSLNVLDAWVPQVPSAIEEGAVVVLANMSPANQLAMLEQCPKPALVIADSMDLWISIAREELLQLLQRVDIFVINEGEARDLAEESNLIKAGQKLREMGPNYVVIKLGEFGAMLFGPQEGWHRGLFRCSAYPLQQVVDPTGAGDSFLGAMAGFLSRENLAELDDQLLRKAVVYGSVAASFTCEAFSTHRLEEQDRATLEGRVERLRAITHW